MSSPSIFSIGPTVNSTKPGASTTTRLHRLRRNHSLSLVRPKGLCLRAERGLLWVTVDGEPLDIELMAGQRREFGGNATVVVGALGGDAVFSVTRPLGAASRAWRTAAAAWAWLRAAAPRVGVTQVRT